MKKILCIGLVLLLFISVPIKGYSAAPVVYGIGEEIILPFILSLLGVQAVNSVDSYTDLKDYHDEVYSSLIENLSGLAGIDTVMSWISKAAQGLIETDSIVWQKLQEIALSNYIITSSSDGVTVPSNNVFNIREFSFQPLSIFHTPTADITCEACINYGSISGTRYNQYSIPCSSVYSSSLYQSYTYNGKTVYYNTYSGSSFNSWTSTAPIVDSDLWYYFYSTNNTNRERSAWLALYGGYVVPSENIAEYSNAFDFVLSSSEKEDLIDGSNVIQLYNPTALQNGLEIIPGGDPEEDPNLKKIPFAVTADWWNFLQQFGSGTGNQVVNAYNALNGIGENVTTGLISKAYDALGIASIAGSAANAAQGIISLTDNNIYPASQTAADAITNTIPSGLTPEAPDSGIDNESDQGLYKLPDLRDYFPFCIPFDLIDFLSCFAAEPETPHFIIALSDGEHLAQQNIDLEVFNDIAAMVRTFELAIFVVGLILITRNLIRG